MYHSLRLWRICPQSIQSYWHCPHSMRSRVYKTVRCPSVCPSVRLSVCSRLAAVGPAGKRCRSIAAEGARAEGECGQCHVVSVRRQLKTDGGAVVITRLPVFSSLTHLPSGGHSLTAIAPFAALWYVVFAASSPLAVEPTPVQNNWSK